MKINPIVGQKGQKYGLIHAKGSALFQDDEEESDVNTLIRKEEFYKQKQIKLQQKNAEILAADPMAFAYDEVYDEMKKTAPGNKKQKKSTEPEVKKPKYVHALLKQAHDREKNDNLIFQHKLQNELEAEKALFGDDFKEYITPTWAKQIAENKKHAAKLARRSEMDEMNDVTKKKDLSGFYRNLERNVAMGGRHSDSSEEEAAEVELARRSPSPDTKADRARRKRERSEMEGEQAKQLKIAREEEKERKLKELQDEYAKHQTANEEVDDAKARFLERKRRKEEELSRMRAMAREDK